MLRVLFTCLGLAIFCGCDQGATVSVAQAAAGPDVACKESLQPYRVPGRLRFCYPKSGWQAHHRQATWRYVPPAHAVLHRPGTKYVVRVTVWPVLHEGQRHTPDTMIRLLLRDAPLGAKQQPCCHPQPMPPVGRVCHVAYGLPSVQESLSLTVRYLSPAKQQLLLIIGHGPFAAHKGLPDAATWAVFGTARPDK